MKAQQYRARFCPDDSDEGYDVQQGTAAECEEALYLLAKASRLEWESNRDDDGMYTIRIGTQQYGGTGAGSGSVLPVRRSRR